MSVINDVVDDVGDRTAELQLPQLVLHVRQPAATEPLTNYSRFICIFDCKGVKFDLGVRHIYMHICYISRYGSGG